MAPAVRLRFSVAVLLAAALAAAVRPLPAGDGYADEVRRRLQRWEAAADPPAGEAPAPAPAGTRSGYALCIGLNRLDPAAYAGWDGALTGCENDAEELARLAEDRGFTATRLFNDRATLAAVRSGIRRLAGTARAGDIVLIGFAGHGGQVPDFNGDEDDGLDETWCLYDGQAIDDEMMALWTEFAAGVRLLVITDSCHGGTTYGRRADELRRMAPASDNPRLSEGRLRERLARLGVAEAAHPGGLPSAVRAMPPTFRNLIRADPALLARYADYGRGLPQPRESEPRIRAAVLFISGCQEDQLAVDGPANGLFTATLKELYARGQFARKTYRDLHRVVAQEMPLFQQPTLFATGRNTAEFLNQAPFER